MDAIKTVLKEEHIPKCLQTDKGTDLTVTYKIEDLGQEPDKGTFYSQELQRIDSDHIYDIDSLLAKRRRKVVNKWVKEITGMGTHLNLTVGY